MAKYQEVNSWKRRISSIAEWIRRGLDLRYLIYRTKWNFVADHDYVTSFPLHLDIETTDACNLKCVMCVHGTTGVPETGRIDVAFAKSLIDQAVAGGTQSIKFNWRGEPALHTGLEELVAYAKKKGILEVQFNTNGIPFTRERIQALIEAGLDRVIVSIDGATKETYESIRIGATYERLMNNVRMFYELRTQLGRQRPFIRVQMVRMRDNESEVQQFLEMWKEIADDIAIKEVTDRGQGGHFHVGDQVAVGRRRCNQPWQRMIVARDGKVFPCCSDWYRTYEIGDATSVPLKEIWHGARMEQLRDHNRAKRLDDVDPCKKCFVLSSYEWRKMTESERAQLNAESSTVTSTLKPVPVSIKIAPAKDKLPEDVV